MEIFSKITLGPDHQTLIFFYKEPILVSWDQLTDCLRNAYNQNFALQAWCEKPCLQAYQPHIKLKFPRQNDDRLLDLFTFIFNLTPCVYEINYDHFLQKLNYYRVDETAAIIAFDKICISKNLLLDWDEVKPLYAALTLGIIKKYFVNNPDNQYENIQVKQYNQILYVEKYKALYSYFLSDQTILPEDVDKLENVPENYVHILQQKGIAIRSLKKISTESSPCTSEELLNSENNINTYTSTELLFGDNPPNAQVREQQNNDDFYGWLTSLPFDGMIVPNSESNADTNLNVQSTQNNVIEENQNDVDDYSQFEFLPKLTIINEINPRKRKDPELEGNLPTKKQRYNE